MQKELEEKIGIKIKTGGNVVGLAHERHGGTCVFAIPGPTCKTRNASNV